MALSLLCGGLGVAEATVHVVESGVTYEVLTTQEVTEELDKKVSKEVADLTYAKASDVATNTRDIATNTRDIATNKGNISELNGKLTNLTTVVDGKVDKADTLAGYSIKDAYTKGDVDDKLNKKADAANVYTKTDADANFATSDALTTAKTELDAKINANTKKITDLQTTTNGQQTAIDKLNEKTAEISYADGDGTRISGVTIKNGNIVGDGNSAITQLANVETDKIETDEINGKSLTGTTVATEKEVKDVADAVKTETDARTAADIELEGKINAEEKAREAKDKELRGRIGTVEKDGNYIKNSNTNNVSQNVRVLDVQVKVNEDAIAAEKTAREAADTKLEGEITKNSEDIATLNGKVTTAQGDITALQAKDNELARNIQTNADNIQTNSNAIADTNKRTAGIQRIDATKETTIEGNVTVNSLGNVTAEGDVTAKGKLTGDGVDAGAGAITTKGAVNAGSLNVTDASHLKGDVTMDNKLSVTGDTTLKGTKVDGKLAVTDDADLKNTTVGGTLGVTGATTLSGELTAKEKATFEKNVTVQNDLTVDGKLNVGEIYMEHKKQESTGEEYDSATSITADGISNRAKVTDKNGNTTESKFTHNEKGTFNYAKDQKITGEWKGSTSNVTADGVSNKMTDSDGNTHTYYQTATETREQLVNGDKSKSNFEKKTAEGNTISITEKDAAGNPKSSLTNTQTVNGEKTSVTNKDSSSTIKQGADQIRNYVASTDGTKSSTEVKADGITNTSDGTITNDANHIENKANTMDTTVTGKATESYGELETTVNGNETHTVTGNQDIHVTGDQTTTITGNKKETVTENVTEDYKKDLTTTVGGNETHEVKGTKTETVEGKLTENFKGGQETNVTGDQTTNVSGTQTINATDINRNASSGMIDTVDNAYGTNKETKVAGSTTTEVSIKGTGESGTYIRGATEARDYIIKGTLSNSETKTAEATSTKITDGNGKTSSTIQDKTQISGSVTNGTSSAVSNVKADSIDTAVIEGTNTSLISQKKDSITSAVGNGTTSTVIQQGDKDITIASNGGTVGIVGKDIINNATDEITNTAGTKITDKVGNNTRVINQTSITDTVGTASRKIEDGKITDTAGDSTVTTENGKGTTFAKAGSTAYSTKAGAPTDTNIAGNHITTGRVDANELGVSDKDDQGNTADFSVKAGKGIKGSVTDKDGNKTYTTVTATENSFQVQDKDGNIKNHQVNTKDSSENTITNGDKTNTVTSTADGTTFNNSKANTAFEGGTYTDTTIKGNTITTGKVTMDYADVMKDLGVRGSAKVEQNLEVGGTSTLKGDVTMESNAKVKKNLTVEGTTTTKTLKVTENAEIDGTLKVAKKATFDDSVSIAKDLSVGGDVTAKSYKVGDKTYIDANGINANNQKITNVADGSISEGSKDAVNGGQLYNVKNDLEGKVNKVGANAAAMANLHPMEFDPDSKWNIAAAIGNYGSETAAALGAFYRPNDDVMVNLSTAFGTGENMVGGGVSVRLGKGGNKLSREESNALKDQVNDLTARMDALLSVLNPNMSKDFPDVPENHWAYEAVSRLAGNDIVQGYPDGEFHGERTMTRYEMAEIIYNALSRGAEAERELVEEFKPELQAMAASEKATAERAEG